MKHKIFTIIGFCLLIAGLISCSSMAGNEVSIAIEKGTFDFKIILLENNYAVLPIKFNSSDNEEFTKINCTKNNNTYKISIVTGEDASYLKILITFTVNENNKASVGEVTLLTSDFIDNYGFKFYDGMPYGSMDAKIEAVKTTNAIAVQLLEDEKNILPAKNRKNYSAFLTGNVYLLLKDDVSDGE